MSTETIDDVPLSKDGLEHYFRAYEEFIGPMREDSLSLLELGVADGASLTHWETWLPNALITGLDVTPSTAHFSSGRVATYQGEQQDRALLDRIGAERAPEGFDVIIDDASHVGQLTKVSFWHLFKHHLKPGGLYFIEDWGTGYWPQYPDGKRFRARSTDFTWYEKLLTRAHAGGPSRRVPGLHRALGWLRWHGVRRRHPSHDHGMVGFVKTLIDECGIADATHETFGTGAPRASRFKWMRVSIGHVIICKAE